MNIIVENLTESVWMKTVLVFDSIIDIINVYSHPRLIKKYLTQQNNECDRWIENDFNLLNLLKYLEIYGTIDIDDLYNADEKEILIHTTVYEFYMWMIAYSNPLISFKVSSSFASIVLSLELSNKTVDTDL